MKVIKILISGKSISILFKIITKIFIIQLTVPMKILNGMKIYVDKTVMIRLHQKVQGGCMGAVYIEKSCMLLPKLCLDYRYWKTLQNLADL